MIISIILKAYSKILLSIGGIAFFILLLGFYFLFFKKTSKKIVKQNAQHNDNSASVLDAIAGGDVLATQLDLARAYIESGKQQLAKKLLLQVAKFGEVQQQREAQNLLILLGKD